MYSDLGEFNSYVRRKTKSGSRGNPKYVRFIRERDCIACGIKGQSQAHHVRSFSIRIPEDMRGGMGMKPSDFLTVPLCHVCHASLHKNGMNRVGLCPEDLQLAIILNLIKYIEKKEEKNVGPSHNDGGMDTDEG